MKENPLSLQRLLIAAVFSLCLMSAGFAKADGGVPQLRTDSFANTLQNADHPVLIEFKAKWCPYCKKEQPDIEKLRADRRGTLDVYQVDVDEDPNIASDYDAHILPTLIIVYHGKVVGRSEGALYGSDLTDWVKEAEDDARKDGLTVESDSPQPL